MLWSVPFRHAVRGVDPQDCTKIAWGASLSSETFGRGCVRKALLGSSGMGLKVQTSRNAFGPLRNAKGQGISGSVCNVPLAGITVSGRWYADGLTPRWGFPVY